jgi:isocitrate dehydrogenase (NAD+)
MDGRKIVLVPGDGIGPEISKAAQAVLESLDCGLEFVPAVAGLASLEAGGELLPQETLDLIADHGLALKGPLTTPIGEGFTSINVQLRRHFDLYANLRPAQSYPGTSSCFKNVDILTVRENTEGLYAGVGDRLLDDGNRAESIAVITREGSNRVLRFAYETARRRKRRRVAVVHKANILKATSGLFLECSRQIRQDYPEIETRELIVDNACMQLVLDPHQFDVIVTTNLFGDIISDICAGLIGGLGLAPGANIGDDSAIFEAVHGSAPDIAGRGIANPSALILAAAMMLDQLDLEEQAVKVRQAVRGAIESHDRCTPDLGGSGTTRDFAQAIIDRLNSEKESD